MHGSVTKYGHRAGLAGAGVLARMILASFWMKIPVAYRRRYGGEGLGFGSFTDGYMISGQGRRVRCCWVTLTRRLSRAWNAP